MTSSVQIEHFFRNYPNFLGCFPADELPKFHYGQKPCGLVANYDKHTKVGSHWIAFYFPKTGSAEYFDPLGYSPDNSFVESVLKDYDHFTQYLRKNSSTGRFTFSKTQWELPNDSLGPCGEFSSAWLINKLSDGKVDYLNQLRDPSNYSNSAQNSQLIVNLTRIRKIV